MNTTVMNPRIADIKVPNCENRSPLISDETNMSCLQANRMILPTKENTAIPNNILLSLVTIEVCQLGCLQRAGIADGGEIEFRPPELLPGFLIKLNIKN